MNFSPRPLACVPLVVLAVIALASPQRLLAFGGPPGGPFGNGSYFPTEGTFQATIRAMNLSGVATFNSNGGAGQDTPASTQESGQARTETAGQASTGGTFAVSYQGSSYTGNVDGSINPSGGSIAAVLEGSSGTSSAGGNGTSAPTTVVNTLDSVFGVIGTRNVDGGTRVVIVQETFDDTVDGGTRLESGQETVYEILDGGQRLDTVNVQRVVVIPGGTDPINKLTLSEEVTDINTIVTNSTINGTTTNSTEVTTVTKTTTTQVPITLPSTTQNVTETESALVNNPSILQTFTVNITRTVDNPDSIQSFTSNVSQVVDNPDTVADDFGWIDTVATTIFSDSLYASGYFNARLKNSFPNQVFKGDGAMSFSQVNETAVPPVLEMVDVPINVRGVRISNTTQNYTAKTVQKPSVVTSTVVENRPRPGTL